MLDRLYTPKFQADSISEQPHRIERIHMDIPRACSELSTSLHTNIMMGKESTLVFLCIGTDRSTGDCLGPLIGSKIDKSLPDWCRVYGTLDNPVHAANLSQVVDEIHSSHPTCLTVAIDACLGKRDSIGFINFYKGPLKPGTGVNKSLPAVGNWHITGVVNVGGFMEYVVLQNTRLNLVMRMADIIANALYLSTSRIAQLTLDRTEALINH